MLVVHSWAFQAPSFSSYTFVYMDSTLQFRPQNQIQRLWWSLDNIDLVFLRAFLHLLFVYFWWTRFNPLAEAIRFWAEMPSSQEPLDNLPYNSPKEYEPPPCKWCIFILDYKESNSTTSVIWIKIFKNVCKLGMMQGQIQTIGTNNSSDQSYGAWSYVSPVPHSQL